MSTWIVVDTSNTLTECIRSRLYYMGEDSNALCIYVTNDNDLATLCKLSGAKVDPREYTISSCTSIDHPKLTPKLRFANSDYIYSTTDMELAKQIIESQGKTFYDDISHQLVTVNNKRIVKFGND